ncbi:hypothetical protein EV182_000636 [Spiromyces aspiralis]|uniref:Uncharacterized protein n=1 Tax=Spiromyces aspiralis TaxID=68401 RepID=A0ACC1HUX0_9FUNG|nr:hypothetical protein EV182_000636 [Spiromyces aspiralis]
MYLAPRHQLHAQPGPRVLQWLLLLASLFLAPALCDVAADDSSSTATDSESPVITTFASVLENGATATYYSTVGIEVTGCPSAVPVVCPKGYVSVLQGSTQEICSYFVCTKVDSASSKTNIGAILGGIFGGLGGLVVIGLVLYFLFKQRKADRTASDVYPSGGGAAHQMRESSVYSSYYTHSQFTGDRASHLTGDVNRSSAYSGTTRSPSMYSYHEGSTGSQLHHERHDDHGSPPHGSYIGTASREASARHSTVESFVDGNSMAVPTRRPEIVDINGGDSDAPPMSGPNNMHPRN